MKNNFATNAPKFFEAGFSVIPTNGKRAFTEGWEQFSYIEQTYEMLDVFVRDYPHCNVGVVLGRSVCVLDIDTDNAEVIAAMPYTPIRRRGRKGIVGFYRASSIENIPGTRYPVEFLNHGKQVVVCGRHPNGMMYQMEGEEDVFSYKLSDLPEITRADIKRLQDLCEKLKLYTDKPVYGGGPNTGEGRNNKLTQIAYAKACAGMPVDQAVEELLQWDEMNGGWFSDTSEPHRGRNPRATATKFYKRHLADAMANDDVDTMADAEMVIDFTTKTALPVRGDIPKPRGLIRLFQDYCNATAFGNQDALGVGGALSMMATLASNKFYTKAGAFSVWPNLYVMNIAHSGFGKETPQRAIDEIFAGTDLIGSATYKSGSSIIMNLPEQPVRLDVIDECAMLLKAMASKDDYKADLVDVLSTLYSKSSGHFAGFTSKGDGKNFGACWNPCVNILGSTTPAGFKSSVSKDMAAKGLLPRFITCWQKDVGDFKRGQDPEVSESILREIKRIVYSEFLSEEYNVVDESMQGILFDATKPTKEAEKVIRFYPTLIPMSKKAQAMIVDIQEHYFNDGKQNPDSFESAFKNRFAQHVAKIALLDTLSARLKEIDLESVEWSHSFVKWQWETAKELYELASAENDHAKDVMRIQQFIKDRGEVSKNKITRSFQGIQWQKLEGILKQLVDGGTVLCVQDPLIDGKSGPRTKKYKYNKIT